MLYDVMMVDPPWPKKKGGLRKVRPNQGRLLDYRVLSLPEIERLLEEKIWPRLANPGVVFLWSVDQFLHDAERIMERAGFRLHARLIWDKQNGVAPAFSVRFCHEYLLWYYRPKFMPVSPETRGRLGTVIREAAREHSRKPDAAYKAVEDWFPQARKLDVFSRESRTGWDQFGDQPDFFQALSTTIHRETRP